MGSVFSGRCCELVVGAWDRWLRRGCGTRQTPRPLPRVLPLLPRRPRPPPRRTRGVRPGKVAELLADRRLVPHSRQPRRLARHDRQQVEAAVQALRRGQSTARVDLKDAVEPRLPEEVLGVYSEGRRLMTLGRSVQLVSDALALGALAFPPPGPRAGPLPVPRRHGGLTCRIGHQESAWVRVRATRSLLGHVLPRVQRRLPALRMCRLPPRLQGQHMADPEAHLSQLSRAARLRRLRLRCSPAPRHKGMVCRRDGARGRPDLRSPPGLRLLTAPLVPAPDQSPSAPPATRGRTAGRALLRGPRPPRRLHP